MKLRLIQKDINNSDYQAFLDDAQGTGCDLVCLSELAVSGCLYEGIEERELASLELLCYGPNSSLPTSLPVP